MKKKTKEEKIEDLKLDRQHLERSISYVEGKISALSYVIEKLFELVVKNEK